MYGMVEGECKVYEMSDERVGLEVWVWGLREGVEETRYTYLCWLMNDRRGRAAEIRCTRRVLPLG